MTSNVVQRAEGGDGSRVGVDAAGEAASGDLQRILAITAHRPHEVREPLRLADAPARTLVLDSSAGFLARNVAAIRQTRRAVREHDPDVAVFDCQELLGTLVTLVCFAYGVATVFRFKGDHWRGLDEVYRPAKGDGRSQLLRYHVGRLLNEFNYRAADGFVVVSEDLKDVVVRRTGCSPDRVAVVHVPIDTDRGPADARRARERFGIEAETVVLTVTNLTYERKYEGVETVVRGLEPVLAADEDVAYVVAGGGPYHENVTSLLDERVADPDVRDRIYAPGFVDAVDDLYALADVFVYVSDIDGYPNVVLEAQQAGLPVVANAAYGMVEQIDDGRTGRLLPRPTPEAIETTVGSLLDSPDERERIGRAARESVRTENDPEVVGRQLVAALARVRRGGAS